MVPERVRFASMGVLLFGTVGCDQVSKHLAQASLRPSSPVSIFNGLLTLSLTENKGAFLSLGSTLPESYRMMLFMLLVGFGLMAGVMYLINDRQLKRMPFIAGTLIISGGLSNLLDRILQSGSVTDFLVIRVGPLHSAIFNIADLIILAGFLLLLVHHLRKNHSVTETQSYQNSL